MRYYKMIDSGLIVMIGKGNAGTEISEAEYNTILAVIHNKPKATEITDYRLREDLTWEAYEIEPPEPMEEEATAEDYAEALKKLGVGVAV